jgi:predicted ABC-type ATPase
MKRMSTSLSSRSRRSKDTLRFDRYTTKQEHFSISVALLIHYKLIFIKSQILPLFAFWSFPPDYTKIKAMDTTTDATPQVSGPALILIRGLPGSGKSYLAAALQDAFGQDQVLLLDPDAIDYKSQAYTEHSETLRAEDIEEKFYPYRFLRSQAEAAIAEHKIVIWNQAFTLLGGLQRTVDHLQQVAANHKLELPVLIIEVEIDHAIAKARVANRAGKGGHDVSEEAFARFINDYRSFADEGFNTVTVNGNNDIAVSTVSVTNALAKLSSE